MVVTRPYVTHCPLSAISLISSPTLSFAHCPIAQGSLLFLRRARHAPNSGPLHVLFPLSGMLIPKYPYVHMGVQPVQSYRGPHLEGPWA